MPLEPKALHDEMNSTTFDEFGRMQATWASRPNPRRPDCRTSPCTRSSTRRPSSSTAPTCPRLRSTLDAGGLPAGDVKVTPISTATDGTQIWRFTHNGVDTHPIHFHLYDVQVLNRVTWDNIIIPTEPSELGWKDTVRMSPLEDTIVALRPIIPKVPVRGAERVRPLNPMMPFGSTRAPFNNIDPQGNPTAAIANSLVNFGWEYVIHCHILSHEEMDMMRPGRSRCRRSSADGPSPRPSPATATTARSTLTWTDNSITETSFLIQRTTNGTTWTDAGTLPVTLAVDNTKGSARTFTDPAPSNGRPRTSTGSSPRTRWDTEAPTRA